MIASQYYPKSEIVPVIEHLLSAGIRFVFFSEETESRSKAFANRIGLETGWNCHISLQDDSLLGALPNTKLNNNSNSNSANTSAPSSPKTPLMGVNDKRALSSVLEYSTTYTDNKARLPKGVKSIRPHIKTTDDVPLLVPLFTECTPSATQEMIKIMQENGLVVLCLGSSLNAKRLGCYSQANLSISQFPSLADECLQRKNSQYSECMCSYHN